MYTLTDMKGGLTVQNAVFGEHADLDKKSLTLDRNLQPAVAHDESTCDQSYVRGDRDTNDLL